MNSFENSVLRAFPQLMLRPTLSSVRETAVRRVELLDWAARLLLNDADWTLGYANDRVRMERRFAFSRLEDAAFFRERLIQLNSCDSLRTEVSLCLERKQVVFSVSVAASEEPVLKAACLANECDQCARVFRRRNPFNEAEQWAI